MEGNQVVKLIVTRCPLFFAFCSAVQRSALVSAASPFQLLKQEELKSSCLLDDVAIFLFTFLKRFMQRRHAYWYSFSVWRLGQLWLCACFWAELWALIEHDSVLEAEFYFWSKSWAESAYAKGQDKSVHSAHQQLRFEIIFLISSISVISNF